MAKAPTKPALVATRRVDHDGVTYEAGDTIPTITDDQAQTLIACGALSAPAPAPAPDAEPPAE